MIQIQANGRVYDGKKYLGIVKRLNANWWTWKRPGSFVGGKEHLRRFAIDQLKAHAN